VTGVFAFSLLELARIHQLGQIMLLRRMAGDFGKLYWDQSRFWGIGQDLHTLRPFSILELKFLVGV
jgi:hypothetical protein